MDKLLLTVAFLAGGLAVLRGVVWLATVGDRKWAARRERMRAATPYQPPTNSRPNDFDLKGRPW